MGPRAAPLPGRGLTRMLLQPDSTRWARRRYRYELKYYQSGHDSANTNELQTSVPSSCGAMAVPARATRPTDVRSRARGGRVSDPRSRSRCRTRPHVPAPRRAPRSRHPRHRRYFTPPTPILRMLYHHARTHASIARARCVPMPTPRAVLPAPAGPCAAITLFRQTFPWATPPPSLAAGRPDSPTWGGDDVPCLNPC